MFKRSGSCLLPNQEYSDFLKVLSLTSSAFHQIMAGTVMFLPQCTLTEEGLMPRLLFSQGSV